MGLSRGALAAVLAVAECTLKSWERGTRSPSLPARRLIWFIDNNWRQTFAPDAEALLKWETVPGLMGRRCSIASLLPFQTQAGLVCYSL